MNSVFVYGSNLFPDQLRDRLIGWDENFEVAKLPNHKLLFNKRSINGTGVGNIVPDDTSCVWGIIIEIDDEDLEELDRYEGYPNHYDRKLYLVYNDDNVAKEVQIYVAQPDRIDDTLSPTADYIQTIIDGAKLCGLPNDYISNLSG